MVPGGYLHPDRPQDAFQIRRKPVSSPNLRAHAAAESSGSSSAVTAHVATSPSLEPAPLSRPPSYTELYGPPEPVVAGPVPRPTSAGAIASAPLSSTPPPPSPSPIQKACGEARHFLGGLIHHPTESNKHFTILRHSHGLVFFHGNTTSVAVSIFSDTPLPVDRTLWLQSKGWTGKAGMRAKSLLHLRDDWIEVTPDMPLRAEQVSADDERAWQRDIKKFRKKVPANTRRPHQLRETAVVRIPAEVGDGYYQLVLCQGPKKKVLANSPVFRVLSTSTSPSSIRGASLSTMPLEVGAMLAGLYAQVVVERFASPVAASIHTKISPIRPSWVKEHTLRTAYSASGIRDRVDQVLTGQGNVAEGVQTETSPSPFIDTPKLALVKVPAWVPEQLRGHFFGWGRFDINTSDDSSLSPWSPAILSVRKMDALYAAAVNMTRVAKYVVELRLLDEVPLQTTKVEVRLMGFLRADIPPPTGATSQQLAEAQAAAAEAGVLADAYDASIVQDLLAHPAWAPHTPGLDEAFCQDSGWTDRTFEGYNRVLSRGRRMVQQVPLHHLGVRSVADGSRDRQVAVNGYYIVR